MVKPQSFKKYLLLFTGFKTNTLINLIPTISVLTLFQMIDIWLLFAQFIPFFDVHFYINPYISLQVRTIFDQSQQTFLRGLIAIIQTGFNCFFSYTAYLYSATAVSVTPKYMFFFWSNVLLWSILQKTLSIIQSRTMSVRLSAVRPSVCPSVP